MSLIRYTPGGGYAVVGSAKGNASTIIPNGTIRGNVAIVDAVYGNDYTATVGGLPFQTVNSAVNAVSSGQTILILPGTYILSSSISLPSGVTLTGISLQTCVLQLNVTSSATMITMADNCRIEYLTINLTCTGSATSATLNGILFGGTTTQTSKLRTCVINVHNSTMSTSGNYTVNGILANGTGTLSNTVFNFNSVKASTINVYSNGAGNVRGMLISNSNQLSLRDTNIYVAQPSDTTSTGSYVGIETNDSGNTGSIQLRSTTVGVVVPTSGQNYTASDILQSTPATITNPTYLQSAGIQIGPGVDLVTKTAGSKGFSTYVYPTIVYYGLKGNITSAGAGYMWPGTQAVSAGTFPDPGLPAAYFRVQQPCLLSGLSTGLAVPCGGTGGGSTLTVTVNVTKLSNLTSYSGYISGTTLTITSSVTGTIVIGQYVLGVGVTQGTYITAGSGTSWTVNSSQTVGSSGSPVAFTSNIPLSTPFTVTFGPTDLTKSFYNNSVTLSAGDLINTYVSYTISGTNSAHDLTAQIDLF